MAWSQNTPSQLHSLSSAGSQIDFRKRIPGPAGAVLVEDIEVTQTNPGSNPSDSDTFLLYLKKRYKLRKSNGYDSDPNQLPPKFSTGIWQEMINLYEPGPRADVFSVFGVNIDFIMKNADGSVKIPRLSVMLKSFERSDLYIPGVTGRLAIVCDPTGEMEATIQKQACSELFLRLIPNSVIVLKEVPVFVRSRFKKQLLIPFRCIEHVFVPPEEREVFESDKISAERQLLLDYEATEPDQGGLGQMDPETSAVNTPQSPPQPPNPVTLFLPNQKQAASAPTSKAPRIVHDDLNLLADDNDDSCFSQPMSPSQNWTQQSNLTLPRTTPQIPKVQQQTGFVAQPVKKKTINTAMLFDSPPSDSPLPSKITKAPMTMSEPDEWESQSTDTTQSGHRDSHPAPSQTQHFPHQDIPFSSYSRPRPESETMLDSFRFGKGSNAQSIKQPVQTSQPGLFLPNTPTHHAPAHTSSLFLPSQSQFESQAFPNPTQIQTPSLLTQSAQGQLKKALVDVDLLDDDDD
ncbi:hypothetical protein BLNAU_17398 [Blattamonas nauphoetae]|uniref:Homologous recombination OB-fold protein OB-fold domain-containing protein n=1 Tax=Blattamonas nauphoetae TaxID=2049346 RepID=A0ABQ9X777_9EUKA|nr:hypothetical protein BLNAU_17398 [Blattamonas nauphoetae]